MTELDYTTDAFGREAVAFIERHKGEPWFLYLAFNAGNIKPLWGGGQTDNDDAEPGASRPKKAKGAKKAARNK